MGKSPKKYDSLEGLLKYPSENFFNSQAFCGCLLLFSAVVAIICANCSELQPFYNNLLNMEVGLKAGSAELMLPLQTWINDGLMAIFFLTVGLEIKREMIVGQLSSIKHAALPIIGALGGMVFPAVIYALFNAGSDTSNGWGIPMATDIAFAIGVLSLLGKRVPTGLKVFLMALAIADDLGSIFVIAFFYPSHAIDFLYLTLAGLVTAFMVVMNRLRVNKSLYYIVPGMLLWFLMLKSGVHATVAGVIMAITIPARSFVNELEFSKNMSLLVNHFNDVSKDSTSVLTNPEQQIVINGMDEMSSKMNPMLHRFEFHLHAISDYFIMPMFAFFNAGVVFDASLFSWPLPPIVPGIFFGLLIGKPLGIALSCWLATKLKVAALPEGCNWRQFISLGFIAGIGFTMAIFVDGLAFLPSGLPEEQISYYVNLGKAVILLTSVTAAVVGAVSLYLTTRGNDNEGDKM